MKEWTGVSSLPEQSFAPRVPRQDPVTVSDTILRKVMEASGIGVWTYDPAHDLLTANPAFWQISGNSLHNGGVSSLPEWASCIHPQDRTAVIDAWHASLKRSETLAIDFRLSGTSHPQRWMRLTGHIERDGSSAEARLLGAAYDISAEKASEKAAAHRHHELLSLFELSAVGMAQADPVTGRFMKVNQRFAEITGYTVEELLERTFVDLTHPEDQERDRLMIGRVQRGEVERWEVEKRYVRPNGEVVWVHVTGRLMTDVDGRPFRTVASIVDISQRKATEKILRDSEERYRAVVESQSGMVCRFRSDGTILFVNHPYAAVRNTTPDQLIGANFWAFIPEADQVAVREMLQRLTPESPEVHIENQFETVDGPRWTMWTNRALEFDENGHWTVGQSTGLDITERKRAEAALREADRRKDEFLATLAHELRNPLAPIRNAVQILNLRGPREPILQEARDMIDRQLNHMVRLIDDLLDLSRITRGKLELRREVLELSSVIDQAVESSQPLIKAGGHELNVSLPREVVRLNADPVRLAQVLSNVLNNAAKYTDRNGRIWLSAIIQGKDVVIAVKDTGIGIAPENLPNLFQMFSQIHTDQQRSQGGLGIGLSLVRGLVEMHGGTVDVKSEGLGCGSEFIVRIPILDDSCDDSRQGNDQDAVGNQTSMRRILVADDNQDSATSLALLLRLTGNEVETAHDGQEAFECAKRSRPDIVLLDIGMPKLDGCATCRMIREQPWGRQMILIAQTGWGSDADRQRTREAGFDGHLVKPVAWQTLVEMLNNLTVSR